MKRTHRGTVGGGIGSIVAVATSRIVATTSTIENTLSNRVHATRAATKTNCHVKKSTQNRNDTVCVCTHRLAVDEVPVGVVPCKRFI